MFQKSSLDHDEWKAGASLKLFSINKNLFNFSNIWIFFYGHQVFTRDQGIREYHCYSSGLLPKAHEYSDILFPVLNVK